MREIAQLYGCARTTMRHFWTLVALIADAFGRRHLVAATMMAFTAAIAGAQFPQSVQPGVRVRVWLPEVDQQENGPWHRQLLRATVRKSAAIPFFSTFAVPSDVWPWRAATSGGSM